MFEEKVIIQARLKTNFLKTMTNIDPNTSLKIGKINEKVSEKILFIFHDKKLSIFPVF